MSFFLVTGATGFLGKAITRQLSLKQFKVLTMGRQPINDIVCDLALASPNINVNDIDFVIHCAGKAHSFPDTAFEKKLFFDINLNGTNNLLKALESLDKLPKAFVYISSVSVYGCVKGIEISEDFPLVAKDSYGLSKIQAEQLVKNWCYKNNVVCTILRLPLLVGKNPPGNLGEMLKAINRGYYFNIGGGTAQKSMVLAEDVAKFIPIIAVIGGTYNLTDGIHPTFSDLSQAIARKTVYNLPLIVAKTIGLMGDVLGKKVPINSFKVQKITSDLTFDDSKARVFGWNPSSVLEYLHKNVLC